jgi:hypothetical protein
MLQPKVAPTYTQAYACEIDTHQVKIKRAMIQKQIE